MNQQLKTSGIRIGLLLVLGYTLMIVGVIIGNGWVGLAGIVILLCPQPRRVSDWIMARNKS